MSASLRRSIRNRASRNPLVEGRLGGVKLIEIGDETLHAAMRIPLEEMPVQAACFAPFVALGEFLAHEEQFSCRDERIVGVEQTEIGELLPEVAGHFVEEGIFAVDDFVVGEGQNEIFGEGVEKREGELLCWYLRKTGSWEKYCRVSFIQPMFHLKLKPRPPR